MFLANLVVFSVAIEERWGRLTLELALVALLLVEIENLVFL
jgi:hypothetical protein